MADYWKSQGRKFCDFCKCWIADNKPSIDFHEGGKKHKENVSKRLKEMYKNSAKQAKQNKKFEDDIKKMENAAMAAYLKDVENNTRDMTANRMVKEKLNKLEATKEMATIGPKADPCDPTTLSKSTPPLPQVQQSGENRTPGKSKTNKAKGKGKKTQEDGRLGAPVRKLWYEALSPEGYTYYWHVETNESVWELPEEGYMTLAEQEEEAKEEALQKELLEQLDKEEAIEKADVFEEQRANIEREKMKQFRMRQSQDSTGNDDAKSDDETVEIKKETVEVKEEAVEEERPYRRNYDVPERSQPYGSWQIVQKIERKPVDLQLPKQKQIQLPVFDKAEPPPPKRVFKEKTVTHISTGDSDDEKVSTVFKKRKFGKKNMRKRTDDQ